MTVVEAMRRRRVRPRDVAFWVAVGLLSGERWASRKNDGGDICRTVERKIERGCRVYLNQAVVSQFARQGIPQPVAFAVA